MFAYSLMPDAELRLLESRHAEEVYALVDANRAHLGRWLEWVDGERSPADARAFIEASLRRFADGNGFAAGIWHRGQLAGTIDLMYIKHDARKVGLGYWVGEAFQRKGLVTAGCRALINYAFGTLGMNRAELGAKAANLRSRAVAERLGFILEGTLRQAGCLDGRPADRVSYGLLRDEWTPTPVELFRHLLGDDTELRLLEPRHAETIFALVDRNREHLRRYLPWVDATIGADVIRQFIHRSLTGLAEGRELHVGIWHRGALAGITSIFDIDLRKRSAELGYWLSADCQGQGLMTRACRALLAYAFEAQRLLRVQVRCEPENTRSAAVATRLGCQYEGTLRRGGFGTNGPVDNAVYALLREEWKPKQL